MATNTATTKNKLSPALRAFALEVLQEVLRDPDFGREFTEVARRRLRAAPRAKKTVSFAEIKKRCG
ncbi:MAG: hypothetical protein NUV53_02720 [Patescibacteria group bacterium]|nr:hypothetical protein [Patescibacteria group bacterium]